MASKIVRRFRLPSRRKSANDRGRRLRRAARGARRTALAARGSRLAARGSFRLYPSLSGFARVTAPFIAEDRDLAEEKAPYLAPKVPPGPDFPSRMPPQPSRTPPKSPASFRQPPVSSRQSPVSFRQPPVSSRQPPVSFRQPPVVPAVTRLVPEPARLGGRPALEYRSPVSVAMTPPSANDRGRRLPARANCQGFVMFWSSQTGDTGCHEGAQGWQPWPRDAAPPRTLNAAAADLGAPS